MALYVVYPISFFHVLELFCLTSLIPTLFYQCSCLCFQYGPRHVGFDSSGEEDDDGERRETSGKLRRRDTPHHLKNKRVVGGLTSKDDAEEKVKIQLIPSHVSGMKSVSSVCVVSVFYSALTWLSRVTYRAKICWTSRMSLKVKVKCQAHQVEVSAYVHLLRHDQRHAQCM